MNEAYFYHLTRQTVDQALMPLLDKCLSKKWRVLLRGRTAAQIKDLDEKLWYGGAESFLPHGLSGSENELDQPILLAQEDKVFPHDCLICIGGATITLHEAQNAARVCFLFQDDNAEDMQIARAQWKTLTDAGTAAQYWSQEQGSWSLKSERKL